MLFTPSIEYFVCMLFHLKTAGQMQLQSVFKAFGDGKLRKLYIFHIYKSYKKRNHRTGTCPGFGWKRVNFAPSSCCVLDFVQEEC